MRAFGKCTKQTNLAWLVTPDESLLSCQVLKQSQKVLLLSVPKPNDVSKKFKLVLKGAPDTRACEVATVGPNYVIARISEESKVLSDNERATGVKFRYVID